MRSYFSSIIINKIVYNETFWKYIKPFLTNKSCHTQNDITLFHDNKVITDKNNLVKTFKEHYMNVAESCGIKSKCIVLEYSIEDNNVVMHYMTKHYE